MTSFLRQAASTQSKYGCKRKPRKAARKVSIALSLALCGLSISSRFLSPAIAQRSVQFNLDSAICNNHWSRAIDILTALVGSDETSQSDRTALLLWRNQLVRYRAENLTVPHLDACDRVDPYQIEARNAEADKVVEPIGWERAIAAAVQSELSTHITTESVPFSLPVDVTEVEGLAAATPVDLRHGLNVVSGQVGTGHQVYSFVAGLGDVITADLNVTRVMTGTLYTSDDSQLFIFDSEGKLLATADDSNGPQSRIEDFVIPRTGAYFAVVTSYNNDPLLTREDYLTGWQDNGGGRFDYTLTLSGATRTSTLIKE